MPTHEIRMDLVPNTIEKYPWWMFEATDWVTAQSDTVPRFVVDNWDYRLQKMDGLYELCRRGGDADAIYAELFTLGSNARLQWLAVHYHLLDAETVGKLLAELWVEPNMLTGGPAGFTSDIVRDIFKMTGFVTDGPERPTETTLVYHGCPHKTFDIESWESWCWTSDRDVAVKFAGGEKGLMLMTDLTPSNVLARFDSRGESEYVLDPAELDTYYTFGP